MSTTPWSARESNCSKPAEVSRPRGNSIARKSTGPSSSSPSPAGLPSCLTPLGSPGGTLAHCGTNLTAQPETRNPRRAGACRLEPGRPARLGQAPLRARRLWRVWRVPLPSQFVRRGEDALLQVVERMVAFFRGGPGWPFAAALAAACRTRVSRGGAARGVVRVSSSPRWLAWATRKPGYCGPRPSLARLPGRWGCCRAGGRSGTGSF